MTRSQISRPLARLGIALTAAIALLSHGSIHAAASERGHKPSKSQHGKVKIQNNRSSSEETSAERDRRLYRECQGRPNSGACAGYTRQPPSRQR